MSSKRRQLEKDVAKFIQGDYNQEQIAWHEAAHMLIFTEVLPNFIPYFTTCPDGRPGVNFKKKIDLENKDVLSQYVFGLLAGYAGELVKLRMTDTLHVREATKALLSSVKEMDEMGFLIMALDNDDAKAYYLLGKDKNAEEAIMAIMSSLVDHLVDVKIQLSKIVDEYKLMLSKNFEQNKVA